jgi:signal peptidase I
MKKALWLSFGIAIILFAGWLLSRKYLVAAYNLPTGSMEKTIPVGTNVIVKKVNYLPIERGEIVVFHFPIGDTVIDLPEYQSAMPYYDVIRDLGEGNADAGRQLILADPASYPLSIRSVSQRETYLKRCVAIPGDTFEIRDEQPYINGQRRAWPPTAQTYFRVVMGDQRLDEDRMKTEYGLDISNTENIQALDSPGVYKMLLTWGAKEKILKDGFAKSITPEIDMSTAGVWPNDNAHHWTRDNFGPLWVPKKDASIELTTLNYPIYERIIRTYEGNQLESHNDKIYINGHEANSYIFKMNYYWTIGDNLHGSQDSRYWGFVPEDHLIGKARLTL